MTEVAAGGTGRERLIIILRFAWNLKGGPILHSLGNLLTPRAWVESFHKCRWGCATRGWSHTFSERAGKAASVFRCITRSTVGRGETGHDLGRS